MQTRRFGNTDLEVTPAVLLLVTLAIYGVAMTPVGFLISTTLLIAIGTIILGERRWWLILAVSIAIPLAFQGLMNLLGIHLEPGLLRLTDD